MDYTPLTLADASYVYIVPLVILGFGVLVALFVLAVRAKNAHYSNSGIEIAGGVFTLAAIVSFFSLIACAGVQLSIDENKRVEWEQQVTSELSAHYGIPLTANQGLQLAYPSSEPEGRQYFGTATLPVGEELEDFAPVTLGYSAGKVYLFVQDDTSYTELPTPSSNH